MIERTCTVICNCCSTTLEQVNDASSKALIDYIAEFDWVNMGIAHHFCGDCLEKILKEQKRPATKWKDALRQWMKEKVKNGNKFSDHYGQGGENRGKEKER